MAFQVLVIIAGLLAGWVRRGSLWNIANLQLKIWWVLPFAYLLQHISVAYLSGFAYEVLIVLSYLLMIVFCIINLRTSGISWTLAGTASNLLALASNGLRMPAYMPAVKLMAPQIVGPIEAGTYEKSIAMTSHTHLNFLGDIFAFNVRPGSLLSIGDILFSIGLVVLIQAAMRVSEKGSTVNA